MGSVRLTMGCRSIKGEFGEGPARGLGQFKRNHAGFKVVHVRRGRSKPIQVLYKVGKIALDFINGL